MACPPSTAALTATELLLAAATRNDIAGARSALDDGADPSHPTPAQPATREEGRFALMWAAFHGSVAMACLLLDRGGDVNQEKTGTGGTALFMAAQEGKPEVARLLLDRGADPNLPSRDDGASPLLAACGEG